MIKIKKFIKNKGFTLIELLVVVAIISLLSSITLASVSESKRKAEAVAWIQYLREVLKATEMYIIDNPPPNSIASASPLETHVLVMSLGEGNITYIKFMKSNVLTHYYNSSFWIRSSHNFCSDNLVSGGPSIFISFIPKDQYSKYFLDFKDAWSCTFPGPINASGCTWRGKCISLVSD
jgi:prepilin-type N-terminal cleavage/methylation domain-containing protein